MRPTTAWAYRTTPRGRVCAVRVHTSPLVELRLRWDHPDGLGRTVTAHRVLAERIMHIASSSRSGALATSHLTVHANHHRFGIAASCWQDRWRLLLRAVLAQLAEDLVTDQQAATISSRTRSDRLHSRNGLDTIADRECLRKLLGRANVPDPEDGANAVAEVTATDANSAQRRLRSTAPLLVLVGDLDPEPSAELASSLLDRASPETTLVTHIPCDTGELPRPVWHTTTRGERSACRLAAIVPSRPQHGRTVADIAAHLLGDPTTGLLTDRLRHQLGCSYDVRCQIEDLGPSRVLMCKAVVAARDVHRAGAEMRAIAAVRLAKHIQIPGVVEEARTAVAVSRLLVNASPSGWASDLVKTLAAGVHPDDAIGVVEQIRSVSAREIEDFVERRLVDTNHRTGDRQ